MRNRQTLEEKLNQRLLNEQYELEQAQKERMTLQNLENFSTTKLAYALETEKNIRKEHYIENAKMGSSRPGEITDNKVFKEIYKAKERQADARYNIDVAKEGVIKNDELIKSKTIMTKKLRQNIKAHQASKLTNEQGLQFAKVINKKSAELDSFISKYNKGDQSNHVKISNIVKATLNELSNAQENGCSMVNIKYLQNALKKHSNLIKKQHRRGFHNLFTSSKSAKILKGLSSKIDEVAVKMAKENRNTNQVRLTH